MNEIFISYAKEDRPVAERLAARLEEEGWEVFWDQRIEVGDEWNEEIQRALQDTRCVVVLWSTASRKSFWVRGEAADSFERDVYLPVLIDETEPPRLFRHIQAQSIAKWVEQEDAAQLNRLKSTIRSHIGALPMYGNLERVDEGEPVTEKHLHLVHSCWRVDEVEGSSWNFHWFKTLNELDLAVNKDSIEMVNILVEYGEIDRKERYPYAGNNPELVIHFKGKPQAPEECYFDEPREVTRLFLALSEGHAEDGPFLSLIDIDGEMVLLDPRKILFVEAPSEVIEEGWKDVIREDVEGTQTSPASRDVDLVPPGLRKRSRHSRARRPKKPK